MLTGGRTCIGIGAGACGERNIRACGGARGTEELAGELGGMRGTNKQEATTCTYPVLRPSTEMIKIFCHYDMELI